MLYHSQLIISDDRSKFRATILRKILDISRYASYFSLHLATRFQTLSESLTWGGY